MTIKREKRQETLVYIVLWGLLFLAPVLSLYIRTTSDTGMTFDWSEVFMVWRRFGMFFAVFLVHNYLLAPLFVSRQKKLVYFSIVTVLVAAFAVFQCQRPHKDRRPPMEQMDDRRPPMEEMRPPMEEMDDRRPPEFGHDRQPMRPPMGKPHFRDGHELVQVIVLILMLGMNLGVKIYFRQREDMQRLTELEHKNLEQQLEYLKYQLNPHFLMNTLNNIHALVDIDGERAKEAVIQLSKILRYVLYESNHQRVPMAKEAEFMDNYTQLMRMRYTDKLRFSVSFPDDVTGITVPPLLFISFVENAFKHGVSYQQESFIDIECRCTTGRHSENRLLWTCRNSKYRKANAIGMPAQGGVGMANVRQRLDLIYGDDYTLDVSETDNTYEVTLDIPLDA